MRMIESELVRLRPVLHSSSNLLKARIIVSTFWAMRFLLPESFQPEMTTGTQLRLKAPLLSFRTMSLKDVFGCHGSSVYFFPVLICGKRPTGNGFVSRSIPVPGIRLLKIRPRRLPEAWRVSLQLKRRSPKDHLFRSERCLNSLKARMIA